jgi:hypothetical protein
LTPKTRLAATLIALTPTLAHAGGELEGRPEFFPLDATLAQQRAASATRRKQVAEHGAAWNIAYDNDAFAFLERNVSNGWSVGRLSNDVDAGGEDTWSRRFRDLCSNLGWVGDQDVVDRVSFTLGQEMFHPADITLVNPSTNAAPYVGLLFVEAGVHTRLDREQHTWIFRLGLVGPHSLAEDVQEGLQDATGGDDPKGWNHQLHTELVANVDYEFRYEGKEGQWGPLDYELEPIFGWAAGTYALLAHTGAEMRLGKRLPEIYGTTSYRSGVRGNAFHIPPGSDLSFFGFLTSQIWGVGNYLPYDGNTFKSSRHVDSHEIVGSVAGGFAAAAGGFVFRYSMAWFTSKHDHQSEGEARYGTLSLSWSR